MEGQFLTLVYLLSRQRKWKRGVEGYYSTVEYILLYTSSGPQREVTKNLRRGSLIQTLKTRGRILTHYPTSLKPGGGGTNLGGAEHHAPDPSKQTLRLSWRRLILLGRLRLLQLLLLLLLLLVRLIPCLFLQSLPFDRHGMPQRLS